jgi:hypothetical protein
MNHGAERHHWRRSVDLISRGVRFVGLAKTKDPSGGTTGRVKPYGRLGWMGARAEYSLDGEGLPLPLALVAEGHPDVQRWFENFFGSPGRHFGRRLCVSASNLRAFGGFSVTATENAAPPKDAAIAIWTPGSFVERERRGHSSSPRVSSARCQSHSPAIRVDRREKLLQGTYRRHTEPFVEIHGGGMFVPNRRILPCEIGVRCKRVVNHPGIACIQRAVSRGTLFRSLLLIAIMGSLVPRRLPQQFGQFPACIEPAHLYGFLRYTGDPCHLFRDSHGSGRIDDHAAFYR